MNKVLVLPANGRKGDNSEIPASVFGKTFVISDR
jgi:hypothetical protein